LRGPETDGNVKEQAEHHQKPKHYAKIIVKDHHRSLIDYSQQTRTEKRNWSFILCASESGTGNQSNNK